MITVDKFISIIRELAKSNYWQTIYGGAKEANLKIFRNDVDLTEFQTMFINYLGFYSNLYIDIYMSEVSDLVTKHVIYEDAYNYYKHKDKKKDISKNKGAKLGKDVPQVETSKWIFTTPRKKKQ